MPRTPTPAIDLTSPEHDALVHLAVHYRRLGNLAGLAAIVDTVRATDAERFTTETASATCVWVLDRWDGCGRIVDSYDNARTAELDANRRNTRNVGDGQRHLREQLAAAAGAMRNATTVRVQRIAATGAAPVTGDEDAALTRYERSIGL